MQNGVISAAARVGVFWWLRVTFWPLLRWPGPKRFASTPHIAAATNVDKSHVAPRPLFAPAISAASGRSLTFRELERDSARLANHLRDCGLRAGDQIVLMDNCVEQAVSTRAARRTGFRAVPDNWQLASGEVAYLVDDSGPHALLAGRRFAESCELGRDRPRRHRSTARQRDLRGGTRARGRHCRDQRGRATRLIRRAGSEPAIRNGEMRGRPQDHE